MPFATVDDPRTVRIHVRFTPTEKLQLAASAQRGGVGMSEYLRRRALGHPLYSRVDELAISELKRLGGLQKLSLTQDATHRPEYVELLREMAAAISRIGGDRRKR